KFLNFMIQLYLIDISVPCLPESDKMTIVKQFFLLMLIVLNVNIVFAMENNQRIELVVIPGQNELGGANINVVLPQFSSNRIHRVETPRIFPDFGQNRCISYLNKAMAPLLSNSEVTHAIIHASSQGTATTLN